MSEVPKENGAVVPAVIPGFEYDPKTDRYYPAAKRPASYGGNDYRQRGNGKGNKKYGGSREYSRQAPNQVTKLAEVEAGAKSKPSSSSSSSSSRGYLLDWLSSRAMGFSPRNRLGLQPWYAERLMVASSNVMQQTEDFAGSSAQLIDSAYSPFSGLAVISEHFLYLVTPRGVKSIDFYGSGLLRNPHFRLTMVQWSCSGYQTQNRCPYLAIACSEGFLNEVYIFELMINLTAGDGEVDVDSEGLPSGRSSEHYGSNSLILKDIRGNPTLRVLRWQSIENQKLFSLAFVPNSRSDAVELMIGLETHIMLVSTAQLGQPLPTDRTRDRAMFRSHVTSISEEALDYFPLNPISTASRVGYDGSRRHIKPVSLFQSKVSAPGGRQANRVAAANAIIPCFTSVMNPDKILLCGLRNGSITVVDSRLCEQRDTIRNYSQHLARMKFCIDSLCMLGDGCSVIALDISGSLKIFDVRYSGRYPKLIVADGDSRVPILSTRRFWVLPDSSALVMSNRNTASCAVATASNYSTNIYSLTSENTILRRNMTFVQGKCFANSSWVQFAANAEGRPLSYNNHLHESKMKFMSESEFAVEECSSPSQFDLRQSDWNWWGIMRNPGSSMSSADLSSTLLLNFRL